jgi:hypothetical protein
MVGRRVTGVLKLQDKDNNNQEQSISIDGIVEESISVLSPPSPYVYKPAQNGELHIILNSWELLDSNIIKLDDRIKNYCSNFCIFGKTSCPPECPLLNSEIP